MAYPTYVPTRVVSVGGAVELESASPLKIVTRTTSTKSLVWDDTGYRFEKGAVGAISGEGSEVAFALPRTDVQGWRDALTGELIDVSATGSYTHKYTTELSFVNDKGAKVGSTYKIGPYVLPEGDGPVDLDRLVPASSTAGEAVAFPDWISRLVADAQQSAVDSANAASAIDANLGSAVAQRVPTVLATEIANPESATNSAIVETVSGAVGSLRMDELARRVVIGDDLATPRPSWPGPVDWLTSVPGGSPLNMIDGDTVRVYAVEAVAWTPAMLPNKVAWWDAQALGLTDGAQVASWTDLSGNGHHAVQATPGSRPTFAASKINGHPAVVADGVDDTLTTVLSSAISASAFTVYLVGGTDLVDNAAGSDFLFGASTAPGGTATRLDLYRTTTEQYALSRGTAVTSAAGAWTTGAKVMAIVFDGANTTLTVNGTVVMTGTTALAGSIVGLISLFARGDGLNFFPGFLGEGVVVQGAVTSADNTKMLAYLSARWGI